jgi:HD-like signal output (HDOD) protein
MPSLFFWRRKQDKPVVDEFAVQPVAAEVPVHVEPAVPAPSQPLPHYPPAMRQIYALALQDERAVEPHATSDQKNMALLLTASRAFAQIGTEPRYTPRRPSLLPQLVEALNDEDASLRALSRIVAQDPQLTGNLLRTANSPLYRVSSAPVESVERATAMLGTTGLRNLLAESLVQPLTSDSGTGPFGEVIWEHALYSASSSEAWSGRSQDADPFTAHLLALLHGLGSVAVYRVLSDLYAAQPDTKPDAAAIADALDTNAGVTAARIATHWGLSERTRQALESQSSAAPVNDPSPLSQALQFGLLTGAMTVLCKQGKLTEGAGLQRIEAAGFEGTQATRIWDRIVRAYVRP